MSLCNRVKAVPDRRAPVSLLHPQSCSNSNAFALDDGCIASSDQGMVPVTVPGLGTQPGLPR